MTRPITVIVADDMPEYWSIISTNLDEETFTIVANVKDGIELLKELENGIPDVIILDINMPHMDGNKAMTKLLGKYPHAKILILTNYGDELLSDDYILRGARGFLPKDELRELQGAIMAVSEGQVYKFHRKELKKVFTARHKEIIVNLAEEKSQVISAKELGITRIGLAKAEQKIKKKFGAKTREQLIKIVRELGLMFLGKPKDDGNS